MKPIEFKASFGAVEKTVTLSMPTGGNGTCHLMIDNYYQGQFLKEQGAWRWRPQKENTLTPEDVAALVERIEAAIKSNPNAS